MVKTNLEALQRALKHFGGSQTELAKAVGCTPTMVSYWMNSKRHVAPESAVQIERATNGQVTRAELRPDIFGPSA